MVGYIAAVGEASAFQEGHILIGDGLPEFIEESGLTDTCIGYDGDGLATAFFGTFKAIEE